MAASKTLIDVEDLLLDILKRLPVKSLCRFRCVCKSWNSLLSSSFFITFHHSYTVSDTSSNHKSFFLMNPCFRLPYALYHPQCSDGERFTYFDPPFTIRLQKCEFGCICFDVFGVIHGVVCLATGSNIVVWNPATRKSLSQRYYRENEHRISTVSFGFDATKNDFKVVSVLYSSPWYDVLSVQDGVWRRKRLADSIHQLHKSTSNSCFINGTIYWIAYKRAPGYVFKDPTLLLFDCEREEFKTMELPQDLAAQRGDRKLQGWRLFKHDNMLSVLVSLFHAKLYELWVMEQGDSGGIASTWKKLYTFDKSYAELLGEVGGSKWPSPPKNLSLDDVSVELGRLHQPLASQEFEESMFLSDVKTQSPPQLTPLACPSCSRL